MLASNFLCRSGLPWTCDTLAWDSLELHLKVYIRFTYDPSLILFLNLFIFLIQCYNLWGCVHAYVYTHKRERENGGERRECANPHRHQELLVKLSTWHHKDGQPCSKHHCQPPPLQKQAEKHCMKKVQLQPRPPGRWKNAPSYVHILYCYLVGL